MCLVYKGKTTDCFEEDNARLTWSIGCYSCHQPQAWTHQPLLTEEVTWGPIQCSGRRPALRSETRTPVGSYHDGREALCRKPNNALLHDTSGSPPADTLKSLSCLRRRVIREAGRRGACPITPWQRHEARLTWLGTATAKVPSSRAACGLAA